MSNLVSGDSLERRSVGKVINNVFLKGITVVDLVSFFFSYLIRIQSLCELE